MDAFLHPVQVLLSRDFTCSCIHNHSVGHVMTRHVISKLLEISWLRVPAAVTGPGQAQEKENSFQESEKAEHALLKRYFISGSGERGAKLTRLVIKVYILGH